MIGVSRGSFDPQYLDLFWRFVCERQLIWHRRVACGLPPPWTNDPILQHERFTNVYRELDPGTKYVIDYILELDKGRPDKLFNVMLYRLVGRASTHAALGFQEISTFDPEHLEGVLKKLRRTGERPFTAAYMVSAYSSMGSSDKSVNVARLFAMLHADFDDFADRVTQAETAAEAHAALQSAYGFGNFLSFQVLVDLLYPLRRYGGKAVLPFSSDEWASAGPGAQKGVKLLLRLAMRPSYLEVMRWLRDHQHSEFSRLDLDFAYLIAPEGQQVPISLANIQNCLCEFHKYVKIREGTGRGRRKFALGMSDESISQTSFSLDPDARSSL